MERLFGIVHYALYPAAGTGEGDLTHTYEPILQDSAFGAIEITWIKDARTRRKAERMLAGSNSQVMFSGGPPLLSSGLNLGSVGTSDRARAVSFAKMLIDMAYELGARNILISSGADPGGGGRDAAIEAFRRSLGELCAYAALQNPGRPLTVCVEPFDREIHWRQLLGPTRLANDLMQRVRADFPNCGLTLDMSHAAQLGEKLKDAIGAAAGSLVHAHIANCVLERGNPLFGDMHPPFDVPGGVYKEEDVRLYVKGLEDAGFFTGPCPYGKPVVSFEIRPPDGIKPAFVLDECKRLLSLLD